MPDSELRNKFGDLIKKEPTEDKAGTKIAGIKTDEKVRGKSRN